MLIVIVLRVSVGLPRIANLYVARIATDSVDLVWTVLDVDPTSVNSFEVRYLEMTAANTTHSLSTAFPNATINRLSSSTVYIFQVSLHHCGLLDSVVASVPDYHLRGRGSNPCHGRNLLCNFWPCIGAP